MAFLEFQIKVELSHALEDTVGPFFMGLGIRRGDEEVIHVDDEPSFSDHISEQVIHESLECGRRVAKSKEHNCWFKKSFVGNKGCLPLVTILDADIILPSTNVECSEVVSIFQLVHEVRDEREGIGVTGGMLVEVSVILTEMEFAILLLDKEEGGCL